MSTSAASSVVLKKVISEMTNKDILLTLLLLPSKSTSPNDGGDGEPSNDITLPTRVYVPPAHVPADINELIDQDHRVDLWTPYGNGGETIAIIRSGTRGGKEESQNVIDSFSLDEEDIEFNITQALDPARWATALATLWPQPGLGVAPDTKHAVWGQQVRRILVNEACVDGAVTQNVVKPVVAALEVYMAGFLRDLNLACQFAFGPDFEYSIQIRHECHTPTRGRSDVIITLEHTFKNQIPEYQSETGQVPWSSARRFSARLLDSTNAAITLTTAFTAGVYADAAARQRAQDQMLKERKKVAGWAPCLVLHIIEDKMVGMIDPLAFVNHPDETVLGKIAIDNVNHIIPQLMRYTIEFRCPWITLSDYLHFLTFRIDPDSTSAELADASGMEFTRDTDKELIPIVLHEVRINPRDRTQTDRKPRMEIFLAVLQRLKDAGFVQEAPLTLVRTLAPLLAAGAANPTFGALVDPSGGNDPDLNEDEDDVIDALDERRRSGKKRHIDSDEESQDEDAWKKRRGEKEEKSDDDDESEDEDDDE